MRKAKNHDTELINRVISLPVRPTIFSHNIHALQTDDDKRQTNEWHTQQYVIGYETYIVFEVKAKDKVPEDEDDDKDNYVKQRLFQFCVNQLSVIN